MCENLKELAVILWTEIKPIVEWLGYAFLLLLALAVLGHMLNGGTPDLNCITPRFGDTC